MWASRKRPTAIPGQEVEASVSRVHWAPAAGPLARMMSERDKANRAALLGGHAARRRQSRKAKSASGAEALAGAFGRRMQLRGWYKGKEFVASLHRDGQIQFAGQKFDSPATAAAKAKRRSANGGGFGITETTRRNGFHSPNCGSRSASRACLVLPVRVRRPAPRALRSRNSNSVTNTGGSASGNPPSA